MSLLRRRTMMENTGSGIIRGSFTPESNQNIYTLHLPGICQSFIVWKHTIDVPSSGYRAFLGSQIFHGEKIIGITVVSNEGGGSWSSVSESDDSDIQISRDTVTINTGNSYFVSEQYDYLAW